MPERTVVDQYRNDGLVHRALTLTDPSVRDGLRVDAARSAAWTAADRAAGRTAVNYMLSDAIETVAHDANLDALVRSLLGPDVRWVMWGAYLYEGTPNNAGPWHIDLESLHWPSVTVGVGIDGCGDHNVTRVLTGTHRIGRTPAQLSDREDDDEAVRVAQSIDPSCRVTKASGFGDGTFYAFNALTWHRGQVAESADRRILFMHFHPARAPRIPPLADYERVQWRNEAAPYLVGPPVPGDRQPANERVAKPPARWRRQGAKAKQQIRRRLRP